MGNNLLICEPRSPDTPSIIPDDRTECTRKTIKVKTLHQIEKVDLSGNKTTGPSSSSSSSCELDLPSRFSLSPSENEMYMNQSIRGTQYRQSL